MFQLIRDVVSSNSEYELKRATLKVCSESANATEASELLTILGLMEGEQKPEKPEFYSLCVRGKHRLVPENVEVGERGGRKCKACQDVTDLELTVETMYCGGRFERHERTDRNTTVRADGVLRCLDCQKIHNERNKANRAGRLTTQEARRTQCLYGHPWKEGFFSVDNNGRRHCLVCRAEKKNKRA